MPDGDAKEWVTVKVPKTDREQANDYRPDDSSYGDCLVAGAERLNDQLESEPPAGVDVPITPTLDDDAVEQIIDEIGAEVGGPRIDDSELAREVAAQVDYAELAKQVADELEGRMR